MINKIVKKLTGREIVFVHRHRNSIPIVEANREKYIFFDLGFIWKTMAIVGRRRKLRYSLMYAFLNLVNPAWIIDINWLDKIQTLFLLWAKRNQHQFIVIQHGIYYGGMMRDIPEKYIKCNIMLVWGDYFREMFLKNNPGKDFRCISFGNPIYNQYDRETFRYSEKEINRILLAPSLISGGRLERQYKLIDKLKGFGFDITVKEHKKQSTDSEPIKGCAKTSGDDFHLYRLLESQEYDLVITDVSSAMTDIIFFKNKVLYFSPDEQGSDLNNNIYSDYLRNLDQHLESVHTRQEIVNFIDLDAQEKLLKRLIKVDDLSNNLRQLTELRKNKTDCRDINNFKRERI